MLLHSLLTKRSVAHLLPRRSTISPLSSGFPTNSRLFSWWKGDVVNQEIQASSIDVSKASSTAESDTAPSHVGEGEDAPQFPQVLALPVARRPLFPGLLIPLSVSCKNTINAVVEAQKLGRPYVGVFLEKSEGSVLGTDLELKRPLEDVSLIHEFGTFAQVRNIEVTGDGTAQFLLMGHRRCRITDVIEDTAPLAVNIEHISEMTLTQKDIEDNTVPGTINNIHDKNENNTSDEIIDNGTNTTEINKNISEHLNEHLNELSVHTKSDNVDIGKKMDETNQNVNVDIGIKMDETNQNDTIKALSNELLNSLRQVVKMSPVFREHLQYFNQKMDMQNPGRLADFGASLTTSEPPELQEILETLAIQARLEKALLLLKKEQQLAELQKEISAQVEEKISKNQREYFLMEQYKQIKKELGLEKDDKTLMLQGFRDRLAKPDISVPAEVQSTIDDECEKFSSLEKNSSEYNVTRNYLDWLTSMPWGKYTKDTYDVSFAREVLSKDHHGLEDVKDRILEFIAVSKLRNTVEGNIICLTGPPGVGKTSIGKSIAEALGREFYRFSVGGLSDVSEIKGHRRTYVGSQPGKLIQCLKLTKSSNPLILIDEIDKLGRGNQGDPASALLELLDPSQNGTFLDYYLDVPVDLSKCLFVCTANITDTIPGPLLDRMEVVRLSGYDLPEKMAIAREYLEPKVRKRTGLYLTVDTDTPTDDTLTSDIPTTDANNNYIPESLQLDDSALDSLIRWYCREAGVRNLENHIERIYRKIALEIVEQNDADDKTTERNWTVTSSNIDKYIGKKKFISDKMYLKTPIGVTMGLAWTSMGGSTLYIETLCPKPVKDDQDGEKKDKNNEKGYSGTLRLTGQLGDVMKESAQIAHTFSRSFLQKHCSSNFLEVNEVHLHVPEGATPKDGPSAGCTIITSILSLATATPVRKDLAMTGEVSLMGRVMPVGGIKEKVIAAKRSGVEVIILPKDNESDFDELPDYLKEGLETHFAENYSDVFNVAFPDGIN